MRNQEKKMKKKYNNRYMEDITTIQLIQNSKRPIQAWIDKNTKRLINYKKGRRANVNYERRF